MKTKIIGIDGKEKKAIDLPSCFSDDIREDLIGKAFLIERSVERGNYGAFEEAGKRAAASDKLRRRRRAYKTSYGKGISRVPRKVLTRRGTSFYWVGAHAPGTVGGRKAHPPKAGKVFGKRVNRKEWAKALKSAIAATADKEVVLERYEKVQEVPQLPIVVEKKFEELSKAKEIKEAVGKILGGVSERAFGEKSIRAGRGKSRGRKYKKTAGFLIVAKNTENLSKGRNLGMEVVNVNELQIGQLAPGGKAGRVVIYTEDAIKLLGKV